MKFLDKLINFIFSLAMMVVSVVVLLVAFNFTSSEYINSLINDYVWNVDYDVIVITVAIIVFLAGLKTTIFLADFKKKKKIPIMVNTEHGNIQIASETIENIAGSVAKSFDDVKEVNTKMVNRGKGVNIYMTLLVDQDSNVRALTREIQEGVKNKIHDNTGVLVLNTDIKVKNIVERAKKTTTVQTNSQVASVKENTVVVKEENKPTNEVATVEKSE